MPPVVTTILIGLPRLMEGIEAFRQEVGYYPQNAILRQPLFDLEARYVIEEFVPDVTGYFPGYHSAAKDLDTGDVLDMDRGEQLLETWRTLIDQGRVDVNMLVAAYTPRISAEDFLRRRTLDEQDYGWMAYELFSDTVQRLIEQELQGRHPGRGMPE